jgi:predicted DNA-binding transcriptional regulator AlpA
VVDEVLTQSTEKSIIGRPLSLQGLSGCSRWLGMKNDHGDGLSEALGPEPLWTAKDVATFLRVSRSWVYHRAEAGDLPCLQIGGLVRFEPERIRAYARGERPAMATGVALRKG